MRAWFNYIKTHWFLPFVLAALLALAAFSAATEALSLVGSPYAKISFFDVGQGDSIFVTSPSQVRFLIDGGPDEKVINKLSGELPWRSGVIDGLILTHPDADHITGALAVLQNFEVKNAFITGVFKDTLIYRRFLRELARRRIPTFELSAGNKITIGKGLIFEVLSPVDSVAGIFAPKANNTSAVLRLTVGERSFLLTGDIESVIEQRLIENLKHADVLKVAHHGSSTSTAPDFLNAVSPGIAVIEVGQNNSYGHPRPEIIERLKPSVLYRTDQNGDIEMWTDGIKLWVSPAH